MCILCGELVSSFHWSDVNFKETSIITSGENAKERKQARLKRVKFLNEILDFYGLKIADWQGSKFVLSNKLGVQALINDLGDLWQKAAELAKRDLDALDEKLLDFLQRDLA